MGLGTKNRQKQTADICKQHLREKYRDKLALVEEFIVEFEGVRKDCDITRWGQFTTPGKEDEIVGAVPLLDHVRAFMNLAAQGFLVQVSTQEEGLDRLPSSARAL